MSPHSPFSGIMQESDDDKRSSMLGQRLSVIESEIESMEEILATIDKSIHEHAPSQKMINKAAELRRSLEDLSFERDAIETEMDNITYEACIE